MESVKLALGLGVGCKGKGSKGELPGRCLAAECRDGEPRPVGHIQSSSRLCVAREVKVVSAFLKQ